MVKNMDQTVSFKFDLNLKKLSVLQVAAILWEKSDVKQQILEYTSSFGRYDDEWWEIVQYLLTHAESLELPSELLEEVRIMIILMGQNYRRRLRNVVGHKTDEWRPKMCWTPYGTVDEVGILKEITRKNPNFFTDVENIMIQKSSTSRLILFVIGKSLGNLDSAYQMINIIIEKTGKDLEFDQLFFFCARIGYTEGADYFFEKIEDKEKIYELAFSFLHMEEMDFIVELVEDHYEFGQRSELLLYLLRKKPEKERKEFIINFFSRLYYTFLKSWSYVPISMELLKYHDCLSPDVQTELIRLTITVIRDDFPTENAYAYLSVFQSALKYLLQITPEKIKLDFFWSENCTWRIRTFSYYSTFNIIINDPDLQKYRSVLLGLLDTL